jgi:hypothetical protein
LGDELGSSGEQQIEAFFGMDAADETNGEGTLLRMAKRLIGGVGMARPVDRIGKHVGPVGEVGFFKQCAGGNGGAGGENQIDRSVDSHLAFGHPSKNDGDAAGGRAESA